MGWEPYEYTDDNVVDVDEHGQVRKSRVGALLNTIKDGTRIVVALFCILLFFLIGGTLSNGIDRAVDWALSSVGFTQTQGPFSETFNKATADMAKDYRLDIYCLVDLFAKNKTPTSLMTRATMSERGLVLVFGDVIDIRETPGQSSYDISLEVWMDPGEKINPNLNVLVRATCTEKAMKSYAQMFGVEGRGGRVGLAFEVWDVVSEYTPCEDDDCTDVTMVIIGKALEATGDWI